MPDTPQLRLEWMDAASLADNPANWRTHPSGQTEALSAVIEKVGWAGALLYNEATKRLIDGHARKGVPQARGGKVPVLVGSWSEEDERLILATLDPLAAMAGADAAQLDALLKDVDPSGDAVALMLGDLAAASNLYQANQDGGKDDPADHWNGMPGFEQEDKSGIIVHVHMETEEDVAAFEKLIGGKVPTNTKAVWYPYRPYDPPGKYQT